jgi:hypothetical protein
MKMKRLAAAVIIVLILPLIVSAQSFLLEDWGGPRAKLSLRCYWSELESRGRYRFGIYNFSVNIPVGKKLNVVGILPFATYKYDTSGNESGSGNIYLGLQYRLRSTPNWALSLSAGAFLPTLKDSDHLLYASGFNTIHSQLPLFDTERWTLYGNLAYRRRLGNNITVGIEAGPYITFPKERKSYDKTEVHLHYGLFGASRLFNYFTFRAELAGAGNLTENHRNLGERFVHELAFGLQWNRSFFRPGLFYKIYLKSEFHDGSHGTFGLRLEFWLR